MVANDAGLRAGGHDHDTVGERDGFLQVMRHEHHGLAIRGPEVEEQRAHDLPGLRVERAEGLVHQQDLGVADQDLREADALALAAGELMRIAIRESQQAYPPQPPPRLFQRRCPRCAADLQGDGDVVERRLPRHQGILLEQVPRLAVQPCEFLAEDGDRARCRPQQACRCVQQGGLAAPCRPDDGDEFALGHPQRHGRDRFVYGRAVAAIADGDAVQHDGRRWPRPGVFNDPQDGHARMSFPIASSSRCRGRRPVSLVSCDPGGKAMFAITPNWKRPRQLNAGAPLPSECGPLSSSTCRPAPSP